MVNREDIESFLLRAEVEFEEIESGLWLAHPSADEPRGEPGVVVRYEPPVVVLNSRIREAPDEDEAQLKLWARLLELNAIDLVHGAFGLENGEVILSDTLELENLQFSEFRASLESLTLAVVSHWQELSTD
jgi:hypothetical protein